MEVTVSQVGTTVSNFLFDLIFDFTLLGAFASERRDQGQGTFYIHEQNAL